MIKKQIKEQQVTVPLNDLIFCILGDYDNGWSNATISHSVAAILDFRLEDSLLYKVVFTDQDDKPLEFPQLWRYPDWKTSQEKYYKAKKWSHKQRIERQMFEANIANLSKAISKTSGMYIEDARGLAYTLMKKGNKELLEVFGMIKIITEEKDLP